MLMKYHRIVKTECPFSCTHYIYIENILMSILMSRFTKAEWMNE